MDKLRALDQRITGVVTQDEFVVLLEELKEAITQSEQQYPRETIMASIANIRRIAAASPFVSRAQTWPKGYQGDFETIAHIIAQLNKATPGTSGHIIEQFFLNSDICTQHNNKITYQARLISDTVARKKGARILSIGCGTSEDIRSNIYEIKSSGAAITLIDIDKEAIDHSISVLKEINEQITTICGNIYKLVKTLSGTYDLIIIGGVFDYLSDRVIVSILSSLKAHLNKGITIFFTNIKNDNPYRIFMEYLADWILIERSEEDIHRLVKESGCDNMGLRLQLDDTGLTYLAELKCGLH